MKSYTDLEQSRKLAEILPLESADMHYNNASIKGINYVDAHRAELMEYNRAIKVLSKYTINPLFEIVPCWSLAALFSTLPILGENKDTNPFIAMTTDNEYYVVYATLYKEIYSSDIYDNPIDACVDMIEYLCKQKLL